MHQYPKLFFPFLVILPGMIAIALTHQAGTSGFALPAKPDGSYDYDMAIPMMLGHYFPPGLLGLAYHLVGVGLHLHERPEVLADLDCGHGSLL